MLQRIHGARIQLTCVEVCGRTQFFQGQFVFSQSPVGESCGDVVPSPIGPGFRFAILFESLRVLAGILQDLAGDVVQDRGKGIEGFGLTDLGDGLVVASEDS
jgi:hypothetical protein